jgi:hypothetical protein
MDLSSMQPHAAIRHDGLLGLSHRMSSTTTLCKKQAA